MEDFQRLDVLLKRTNRLPAEQDSLCRAMRGLDAPRPNPAEIEAAFSSDPFIAAEILRAIPGGSYTIRDAIQVLGDRAIRTLVSGLLVKRQSASFLVGNCFDSQQFRKHSICKALLAKYLLARYVKKTGTEASMSCDELFTRTLLADLGWGLLAHVAPMIYDKVYLDARDHGVSIEQSFSSSYGSPLRALTFSLGLAWQMPACQEPETVDQVIVQCQEYAEFLAQRFGFAQENWPVLPGMINADLVEIPEAEAALLEKVVTAQVYTLADGARPRAA